MEQGMRDVCIVGGGLVGLSAALTLARQGRSVTLLEARDLGYVEPDAMDARSIALSLSSQRIFESLDLWDDLRPNCAPIRHIHVSSAGHLGMTRLHADELGLEAMGQVVEYHLLQQTLLIEAEREPAIELCFPARIESLQMQDSGPVIEFRSEQEEDLQCREGRLLLLADGGQSDLAARLGLQRESRTTARPPSSPTCASTAPATAGPGNASPPGGRWPCCRWFAIVTPWCGVCRRSRPKR